MQRAPYTKTLPPLTLRCEDAVLALVRRMHSLRARLLHPHNVGGRTQPQINQKAYGKGCVYIS